jgi:hypothetical protein
VITISALQELLKRVESETELAGVQNLVLAVLLVAIMIQRPLGIMGGHEITWPFGRRRRAPAEDGPDDRKLLTLGRTRPAAKSPERVAR